MRQWPAELRYAFRALLAKPGAALAVVLTLALGIGANAAIFGVIERLLVSPLPFPDGEQLVSIYHTLPKAGIEHGGSSVPDYLDERAQAGALADVALYQSASFNLSANGTPDHIRALRATPSLFSTLGAVPLLGRVPDAAEGTPGRDRVVVLSYDAWQTRFAADPGIVGRDVRMDGVAYRIIGVMPRGFFFPDSEVQLWTPYAIAPEQATDEQRGHSDTLSVGRLRPGETVAVLETQFRAIAQRNAERSATLAADYAATGFSVRATPLRDDWFGALRPALLLIQAMVALVLAIACANVANLMLVRFSARRGEFALRAALGARAGRLLGQVLLESVLLSLLGGAAGVAVAAVTLPLVGLSGLDTTLRTHHLDLRIDAPLLLFVLVLALLLGLLLGGLNAAALRRSETLGQLRSGRQTTAATRATGTTRNVLVVAQLALAVMLLTGAGLLLESFRHLLDTSPGFAARGIVTARLELPHSTYPDAAARTRYYQRVLESIRAVPGVERATYTSSLPFGGHLGTSGYEVEGYSGADAGSLEAQRQSVDEDYFATMNIPLVEGRAFLATDSASAAPVVIVDELLAKHMWPGRSAIGQHLRTDSDAPWQTVVGVVPSVHHRNLADVQGHDAMYWPFRQRAVDFGYFAIKSGLPLAAISKPLRDAVLAVDPELPPFDVRMLEDRIQASLDDRRSPMLLLAVLAALGLALAVIGIYGLLAFIVGQRTAEIGVRMAIGARGRDVLGLVLGAGARLIAAGALLGVIGAALAARLMRSQLYGVSPGDPLVWAGVLAVLCAAALLACYVPARRAARLDPTQALRYE